MSDILTKNDMYDNFMNSNAAKPTFEKIFHGIQDAFFYGYTCTIQTSDRLEVIVDHHEKVVRVYTKMDECTFTAIRSCLRDRCGYHALYANHIVQVRLDT